MDSTAWSIIAGILSLTLFVALIIGIILMLKLIAAVNKANKVLEAGQTIAAKADDVVENVRNFALFGGIARIFAHFLSSNKKSHQKGK